jgi:hypothetical protein
MLIFCIIFFIGILLVIVINFFEAVLFFYFNIYRKMINKNIEIINYERICKV